APSAAAVTSGSRAESLPAMSVASSISPRSASTDAASSFRCASISLRTCAIVRCSAIALQRLRRQLRLQDRLLGDGRRPALYRAARERGEHEDAEEQDARHDEQRRPPRHLEREARGRRGEREAEHEEREDRRADAEADAEAERRDLLLQLERGELGLEVDERARRLGDLLYGRAEAAVGCRLRIRPWGGHGLSSR